MILFGQRQMRRWREQPCIPTTTQDLLYQQVFPLVNICQDDNGPTRKSFHHTVTKRGTYEGDPAEAPALLSTPCFTHQTACPISPIISICIGMVQVPENACTHWLLFLGPEDLVIHVPHMLFRRLMQQNDARMIRYLRIMSLQ